MTMDELKEKLSAMDIDNQIIYLFSMLTDDNKKLALKRAIDLSDGTGTNTGSK